MCVFDVTDQVSVADGVAHAPPGCVEGFADGADADGVAGDGGIERCDAGKRGIVGEMLVEFVGEDDDIVASAQGADGEEFGGGEDFAEGVVAGLFAFREKRRKRGNEGKKGKGRGGLPLLGGYVVLWGIPTYGVFLIWVHEKRLATADLGNTIYTRWGLLNVRAASS